MSLKILLETFIYNTEKKVLDEQSIDYLFLKHNNVFETPLTLEMLTHCNEGILHTYPIDKTIEYVKNYFNLRDDQVIITKNNDSNIERINIICPDINNNIDEIIRSMKLCGYFLSFPREEKIKRGEWCIMQFEPNQQKDITQELRNTETFLYHATPAYNEGKIRKIGLSPKSKNTVFNFPNRVFFFKGSTDKNYIYTMVKVLSKYNNCEINEGNYILLKIDIKNLPETLLFFEDPNLTNGVFTKQNIHPKYIEVVEKFNINEK